ncbi:MAG: hypothetical protein ABS879_04280, partial [Eubacteriales bacterium]
MDVRSLLMSANGNHDKKCLECARNQKCELQQLCQELGVEDVDKYKGKINEYE